MKFTVLGSDERMRRLSLLLRQNGQETGDGGDYVILPPGGFSEPLPAGRVLDPMREEAFAVKNAALTADGAVLLLLQEGSLEEKRIVVGGFGRIGRLLAPRLTALGAGVTVAARSGRDRARAQVLGFEARPIAADFSEAEILVNTIPSPVWEASLREGLTYLELASAPFGVSREKAEGSGVRYLSGARLPGRLFPAASAALLYETVMEMVREDAP